MQNEYTHFASLSLNSKTSFFKIALYNDFDDGHFKRERRNEEEEEEEDELRLGRGEKGVFPRRAARGAVHAALERRRRRRRRRDDEQRTDANNENDVVVIENVVVFIGAFLLLPTTGKKI
mgnify:CR=1 FL=1